MCLSFLVLNASFNTVYLKYVQLVLYSIKNQWSPFEKELLNRFTIFYFLKFLIFICFIVVLYFKIREQDFGSDYTRF